MRNRKLEQIKGFGQLLFILGVLIYTVYQIITIEYEDISSGWFFGALTPTPLLLNLGKVVLTIILGTITVLLAYFGYKQVKRRYNMSDEEIAEKKKLDKRKSNWY